MVYSGLYLAWAALVKMWTDTFPFFWLDEDKVGSKEAVTAHCIGFVLLSQFSELIGPEVWLARCD